MSDGLSDVAEEWHQLGQANVKGYCFYHGQDLENAVAGAGLMLAFGDLNHQQTSDSAATENAAAAKKPIGIMVRDLMQSFGFQTEWNGDPERRIGLPHIDWKRRLT